MGNFLYASLNLVLMEIQGKWTKDEDGFMHFETPQLQRMYEVVTDQYHQRFNQYLDELGDEELASAKALVNGYAMVTDYKTIDDEEQFATTYTTPTYSMDIWYELDKISNKRIYEKGFVRISNE